MFLVRNQHFVLNRVNRDVKVFVKDYKGNKVVTHTEDCLLAQTKLSSSLSKRVNPKLFSSQELSIDIHKQATQNVRLEEHISIN